VRPRRRERTLLVDVPIEETLARAPEPPPEPRLWRVTLHFGEKDLYTQFDEERERDSFCVELVAAQQTEENAWVYISDGAFRADRLLGYTLNDYPRRS
jgi:hypothetical protein